MSNRRFAGRPVRASRVGRYGVRSIRARTAARVLMARNRQSFQLARARHILAVQGAGGATEVKAVDQRTGGTVTAFFSTGGSVSSPCGTGNGDTSGYPEEGSGFYNRIGRRIRMKSLHIRGYISPGGGNAAAVSQQMGRIMVLYDRQTNGAAPSIADILTNYDADGTARTTPAALCGLNLNNRDRFVVLRDHQVILPAIGINGATPANTAPGDVRNQDGNLVNMFIPLKGLEMHFKASSATGPITDIATGSLLIVTVSNQDANASPAWSFTWSGRLRFVD